MAIYVVLDKTDEQSGFFALVVAGAVPDLWNMSQLRALEENTTEGSEESLVGPGYKTDGPDL